jgi:MYXO-CTERM domain-containing protein
MTTQRVTLVVVAACAIALSYFWHPAAARACGGFFCNQPGNPFDPPPIAQTAENVLFAMDRTPSGQFQLEAHVQIFYTGPADRFSWVVPVDSLPALDVGTNALFTALVPATQARFALEWSREGQCAVDQLPGGPLNGSAPGPGGGANPPGLAPPSPSGGVDVGFRGDVGPYDAAVVRSTNPNDSRPLKEWLETNMYFLSEEAGKLIDDYVREDKYFVAIRLQSGKGVNEIQPLVMRFLGPGPCIPLRLTAIASIRDLAVNLWVLAEHRVVPTNYFEILINPARLDWFAGGGNYTDLVKRAADEAGGNAFVAEFVGSPSLLRGRFARPTFNAARLAAVTEPPQAMNELTAQQVPRDAALLAILRKHIPMPERVRAMNISEQQFYNQLALYWSQYRTDFPPFDGRGFAADVQKMIFAPLENAEALVTRYPKLTRLSTFISPEEMLVDPLFVQNPHLPDVPAVRRAGAVVMCGDLKFTSCEAPVRLELPDGQKLFFHPQNPSRPCYDSFLGAGGPYNRAALDGMPALQVALKREAIGEGAAMFDNGKAIAAALAAHNARFAKDPPRLLPPGVRVVGPGRSPVGPLYGGCGCATPGGVAPGAGPAELLAAGAIVAAALARRQRRRRARHRAGCGGDGPPF